MGRRTPPDRTMHRTTRSSVLLHSGLQSGLLAGLVALGACQFPSSRGSAPVAPDGPAPVAGVYAPGVPVSHPPFTTFNASWKTRADAHYVYMDHYGSYGDTGALVPTLMREVTAQGLVPDGPPFALFYDDAATTPVEELRSRVCVPIAGARSPRAPLGYEILPQCNVAYAVVSGRYVDAPRAYPRLFDYMDKFNWTVDGPIREVYVVPPVNRDPRDLMCEIQIPVATRR